jgi:glutamate formiminotransferase / 5-formyltetrahydrofolate cyclo-ligase
MLIECISNVSEGRDPALVAAVADAVRETHGVRLLDYSADAAHNRSVFTFVGDAEALMRAVLAVFAAAVPRIDMRTHRGEHPRIGAVDVVPFVPLEGATMEDCVRLARATGAAIADRFLVPVYLYEEAATSPARRRLENIRRGGFERLAAKMGSSDWTPDFGSPVPHETAGASAVGARMPLVAWNINLATDRLEVARAIAATVRESGGGLPHLKAIGIRLHDRGIVQVSMNLTNYEKTPLFRVFEAVKNEAARHGVRVLETEIVGLVPAAAIIGAAAHYLQVADLTMDRVLENRIREG